MKCVIRTDVTHELRWQRSVRNSPLPATEAAPGQEPGQGPSGGGPLVAFVGGFQRCSHAWGEAQPLLSEDLQQPGDMKSKYLKS